VPRIGAFMHNKIGLPLCALAMVIFAGALNADIIVDAGITSGQYGTMDLTTGVFTPINTSVPLFAGMATVNNIQYGADFEATPSSNLYSIDPSTGTPTTIGSQTSIQYYDFGGTLSGLFAFNNANFLDPFTLYSVDPTTGAVTAVGLTTVVSTGQSAFSSNSNTLYLANNDTLYTLNTSTGAATTIGTFSDSAQFDALIVEGGTLYGYDFTNQTIDTINTSTAAVTLGPAVSGFNPNTDEVFGFATPPVTSTPEPGSVMLLGTLAGMLAVWQVRKRSARDAGK
jgi:hypothetical protein